jgi:hypothetical protein
MPMTQRRLSYGAAFAWNFSTYSSESSLLKKTRRVNAGCDSGELGCQRWKIIRNVNNGSSLNQCQ